MQGDWGDSLGYAGILAQAGWDQPPLLAGLIQSWRTLFQLYRPDVPVAHHSPSALLTARCDALPAWRLGSGFVYPPRMAPFPVLRPWLPLPPGRLVELENALLAKVPEGLSLADRPQLSTLADALSEAGDILLTMPELDHDGPRSEAYTYWGLPAAQTSPMTVLAQTDIQHAETGQVLGYVRRGCPHFHEVLAAPAGTGRPARPYCPDAGEADLAPGRWGAGVGLSRQPLDLAMELPAAAVFVCHGGQAASLEAQLAGVPLFLLPMHIDNSCSAHEWKRSARDARSIQNHALGHTQQPFRKCS